MYLKEKLARTPSITALLLLLLVTTGCGKDDLASSDKPGSAATPELTSLEDIKTFTEEFADPELEPFTGDLNAMKERRLIRALVTPSPTEFFIHNGQIRGIQAEYLKQFANSINKNIKNEANKIRIKYVPVPFPELIPALLDGRGDIIATFLTITNKRSEQVLFSAPFRQSVNEIIVTSKDASVPASLEDLAGKQLYVLANSSYVEHLQELNDKFENRGLKPVLIEQADPRLLSEDILEFVNAGVVEHAVVDDYIARLWGKVLKDIVIHDDLHISEGTQVAWAVRQDSPELKKTIDSYVKQVQEGAKLGNILFQRYYEEVNWINNPTSESARDRLQHYLVYFHRYGEKYGFDPLALAAQAYQESSLNHSRLSPAGAVGLMQILPTTAADPKVNIKNIKDPEANIHAGTKYLAFLRDHYFDEPELDAWNRYAFAWASYNAGPRKIRRARNVAKQMGLDPNIWFGNVEVAAARTISREPVRYVANIYRYYVAYRLLSMQNELRDELRVKATNGFDGYNTILR